MKILLAVLPHFQNTSFTVAHLGNACISAYLKKYLPEDQIKTIDLRTFEDLKNVWTSKDLPQMTYLNMYVSDIYDLPFIANIIKKYEEKKDIEHILKLDYEVIETWAKERGFYPPLIQEKLYQANITMLKYIELFKDYDVIGLSLYTSNFYLSVLASIFIKIKYPNTKIVFGGSQITQGDTSREILIKSELADFIVIGEGEEPMLQIIKNLKSNSPSEDVIGVKTKNNFDRLDTFSQSANLEELPIPDYDDIDFSLFNPSVIPIYSNRGCPFRCHFCSEHSLFGKKFKRRSPQKVLEDMKLLSKKYKINEFTIADSLINSSEQWLEEFTEILNQEKEKFLWGGYFRAEMSDILINNMKKAGLNSAILGVESFSQETLDNMNKRKVNNETLSTIRALIENNIHAFVNIFTGYPEEKEEDFQDTYRISNELFDEFKAKNKAQYYHITARSFQLRPFSNIYNDYDKFGLDVESWSKYYDEKYYPDYFKNIFEKTLCSFKIKKLPLFKIQNRIMTMKKLKKLK